jgi:hypothetical protein
MKTCKLLTIYFGLVAQLVEQLTLNQLVLGSSPSQPTKNSKSLEEVTE